MFYGMQFNKDLNFSEHKDILLSDYWKERSFEGRYLVVKSYFLQKNCGIDVILQGRDNKSEHKIDTKHDRVVSNNFFLEEYSDRDNKVDGWITKETCYADYIYYVFWTGCDKCSEYGNCMKCKKELTATAYAINYSKLRDWFLKYKDKYFLIDVIVSKANGRLVPKEELIKIFELKKKVFHFNQEEPIVQKALDLFGGEIVSV